MGGTLGEKKPARFSAVAAWYYGNYCCMKCLREEEDFERLKCHLKIREFMDDESERFITHKDFVRLVRDGLRVCDTNNFKRLELLSGRIGRSTAFRLGWWYRMGFTNGGRTSQRFCRRTGFRREVQGLFLSASIFSKSSACSRASSSA